MDDSSGLDLESRRLGQGQKGTVREGWKVKKTQRQAEAIQSRGKQEGEEAKRRCED